MSDPFANRADALHRKRLVMERDADEDDLFALGDMIPPIELVQEMAEHTPSEVSADDFDATCRQWLETAFAEDGMSDEDRSRIDELWRRARERCAA